MILEKICKMGNKTFIKEIFESVQGEGPYIGYNQLFIRFSKCNLKCKFCDTDFISDLKEYTAQELKDIVNSHKNVHSISLTGGEPLLDTDFLCEFLPLISSKVYLETNGTLYENLEKIINYIDIISMDIKLQSSSLNPDTFSNHEKFIKIAKAASKEIYLKVVFDENISDNEILKTASLAKENNLLLVLQPKMDGEILNLSPDFIYKTYYKFLKNYKNVRLIPQVHKFLNLL